MDVKGFASVVAVVVSGFSLYFSNLARQETHNFEVHKFYSETTMRLLQSAYDELSEDGLGIADSNKRRAAAAFLETLAQIEADLRKDESSKVLLVGAFISRARNENIFPESLEPPQHKNEKEKDDLDSPESSFGKWHALVSSYPSSEVACQHSLDDVREFAELLKGTDGIAGLTLRILKTDEKGVYAVAIDVGNNLGLANKISERIREVSPSAVDGRTGRDSYVRPDGGWSIDKECTQEHKFT